MTCRDCIHYKSGCEFIPTDLDRDVFDYCIKGITDEIPDIEERCDSFNNKADWVKVKRGKWEKIKKLSVATNPYKHTCGLCGKSYFDHNKFNYPYCPNCGADMRGDKNDL